MKKLIIILGILAVLLLVGCAKQIEEQTAPEVPAEVPEAAPAAELTPEVSEPEEPAEAVEPVAEEQVATEEVQKPAVEEEKKTSEIVEITAEIDYQVTNDTDGGESTLDKVKVFVRNTKYDPSRTYPRHDLRVKAYTVKDGETVQTQWINDLIEKEKIMYGMLATASEGRGGYTFKDNVIIYAEVYDSEDILLASASKVIKRS